MSVQATSHEPGEILTFYSYKGGTGRSMALANVACLLAQRDTGAGGVLVVDWDLEAPGLHRYFASKFERFFQDPAHANVTFEFYPGLIDFFEGLRREIETLPMIPEEPPPDVQEHLKNAVNLDSFILSTDIPNLSLLKAGSFDQDYAKRVNTFPWEPLYARAPWSIALVADWLTSRFRYILIDSRTGITDTSGICTMLLPDKLVVVFTPNAQSLDGVLEMSERATNYRRRSADLRPLSVFPLPSRIETSEPKELEKWRKGAGTGYQPRFEALFKKVWQLADCNLEDYLNEVQIQHSATYAYGEKVAALIEQSDNRLSLRRAYTSFAERLVTSDEPWLTQPAPAGLHPLVQQAEYLYAQLTAAQQDSARRLFLQLLHVAPDSTKAVGRQVNLKLLSAEEQAICQRFADQKLLNITVNPDGTTLVSPADDVLITAWNRLAEWIQAHLDFLQWRAGLDAAQSNWEKHGRVKEGLLHGLSLAEAVQRIENDSAELNEAERGYIAESVAATKRKKADYWKWSAAAAVVVLVAVAVWYGLGSRRSSQILNFSYIGSISVVENQYQQFMGQPLSDQGTRSQLAAAINLAKAGQYDASRKILEPLASSVPVPAVLTAVGSLYAEKGDSTNARQYFQQAVAKDASYKPALQGLSFLDIAKVGAQAVSSGREVEPNNDIPHANIMPLNTTVLAEISYSSDVDFFHFTTGHPPRDIYRAALKNTSTTLMPSIAIYDPQKNKIGGNYRTTAGADLSVDFSPSTDADYYVQVAPWSTSTGTYDLTVQPLHRYDSFEPNDDIASAKPIPLGKTIDANIMDSADQDYYQVKSGSAASLTVSLKNASATLLPQLTVYSADKNKIAGDYRTTAGADVSVTFNAQPNSLYYVAVTPFSSSSGNYSVIVK